MESKIQPVEPHSAYDRSFWLTYVSNILSAMAVSLLFRYADFITLLGGTEFHLGWIVGVGMVGSLFTRSFLGSWIDHHGTRWLWLCSLLLFAATCVAHLAVESYSGIAVYLLRIAFCCAMAGFGGASMTFVSARCPPKRLAELIGMLGTAGFLGYVLGSLLGDVLFGSVAVDRPQVELMFILAGLLGLIAIPFAWFATRKEVQLPQQPSPGLSLLGLLRRHNPGVVLVVGVAMGAGLGLPSTFLRTYAAELGIPRIGLFFLVYALAALFVRVITRRWIERFGTRPIILLGMAILAASLMFFLPVHAEWHLILPAIGFGCSHAILFPAVVAVGSYSFPVRNRGLASVLILAMWDLGILVISPVAGGVLRYSKMIDLPPYPMMFLATSSLMVLVGIWYAVASRSVKPAG